MPSDIFYPTVSFFKKRLDPLTGHTWQFEKLCSRARPQREVVGLHSMKIVHFTK